MPVIFKSGGLDDKIYNIYAVLVELADTPDLGSGPKGWGFKSLRRY